MSVNEIERRIRIRAFPGCLICYHKQLPQGLLVRKQ